MNHSKALKKDITRREKENNSQNQSDKDEVWAASVIVYVDSVSQRTTIINYRFPRPAALE